MNLTQAKLGDQFRVFLSDEGTITAQACMRTCLCTVIAIRPNEYDNGELILGWRENEERPSDAQARKMTDPINQYVPNQALYTTGRTVSRTLQVAVQIVNGLDGFPCRKCTNFYQYALPNQQDGTLICWSCITR